MIYTLTFNPAIDYVLWLPGQLKTGGVNRNVREAIQCGGKGINVSTVLHNLGVPTQALGFIAGFTGDGLEQGLQAAGLQTDLIRVTEGLTRINVKIKATEETEINGMGPVITDGDMAKLYEKLQQLQPQDMLVLSGSIPGCLQANTYETIAALLARRNVPVVVDAEKQLLLGTLPHRPFLIKPNHHELADLFGISDPDPKTILECAQKLQEMGARNVLISMAGDGALLLDEQGKVHRAGCPAGQVVNSVGAGDSMVAGFLAGWCATGDYAYALRLGIAAGSATAYTTALADKAQIEVCLGGTYGTV